MVLLICKPRLFLSQKWVKFLAHFLPVEVWMNQPLFSWVTLPGRLLCWLFLASAVEVSACFLQTPSFYPPQSCVGLLAFSSPGKQCPGLLVTTSFGCPGFVIHSCRFFSGSWGGFEMNFTDKNLQAARKWELQIKQRFLCLLSQFLPGPSERRLGEWGREARDSRGMLKPF